MVPAAVHAALVVVAVWLLHLLAAALNININASTLTELAALLVSYILSLFGLAVFNLLRYKRAVVATEDYRPPFT